MQDLRAHEISWLAGYVYVGNGTLGATDGVYYQDVSKTEIAVPSSSHSSFQVPILPTSGKVGSSYVKDVEKHFARKRIHSLVIELISLQPATSNSMVAQFAPVRGAGDSDGVNFTTGTTAAMTLANALGMDGSRAVTSWENCTLDATRFIAGGSGAKQNEFNNDWYDDLASEFPSLDGIAPACIAVSGQNNSTGLRGTQTHMIVIRLKLDYLDFIAGTPLYSPLSADIVGFLRAVVEVEGASALDRVLRNIDLTDPKRAMRLRALCSGK